MTNINNFEDISAAEIVRLFEERDSRALAEFSNQIYYYPYANFPIEHLTKHLQFVSDRLSDACATIVALGHHISRLEDSQT